MVRCAHFGVCPSCQQTLAEALAEQARRKRLGVELVTVPSCPLSSTQLLVVQGLANGKSVVQLANERDRSPDTIRTHVRRAQAATGTHSQRELVAFAFRHGWIR